LRNRPQLSNLKGKETPKKTGRTGKTFRGGGTFRGQSTDLTKVGGNHNFEVVAGVVPHETSLYRRTLLDRKTLRVPGWWRNDKSEKGIIGFQESGRRVRPLGGRGPGDKLSISGWDIVKDQNFGGEVGRAVQSWVT